MGDKEERSFARLIEPRQGEVHRCVRTPDLVAVRPLASAKAATRFVKARLDAYDRLWDG